MAIPRTMDEGHALGLQVGSIKAMNARQYTPSDAAPEWEWADSTPGDDRAGRREVPTGRRPCRSDPPVSSTPPAWSGASDGGSGAVRPT